MKLAKGLLCLLTAAFMAGPMPAQDHGSSTGEYAKQRAARAASLTRPYGWF